MHSTDSTAFNSTANDQQPTDPALLTSRPLRVAVIGSGLAGLTAAHLLSSLYTDDGHGDRAVHVELFEKAHKFGMDAASLSVTCPCSECARATGRGQGDPNHEHVEGRMDVPMRSFFSEYYPNLVRLYRSIGVKFHDADNTLACFDVSFQEHLNQQTTSSSSQQRNPRHFSSNSSSNGSSTVSDSEDEEMYDEKSSCSSVSEDEAVRAGNVSMQEPYLSSRSYKINSKHTMTLPDMPPFSIFNPKPFGSRLLGYYRIARDYVRLIVVSKEFMHKHRMMDIGKHPVEWGNKRLVSLREFLEGGGYSQEFSAFFVPLFASVCTCSFDRMMEYPACVVLEYVARCMPLGRMQFVTSGVRQVTKHLSYDIDTVHYNTSVEQILDAGESGTVGVRTKSGVILVDNHGVRRSFDHVIFATQANQAAAILAGQKMAAPLPRPFVAEDNELFEQREANLKANGNTPKPIQPVSKTHPFYNQVSILQKFPYERTQVVCHTDTRFLPKNRNHWRLLNIAKSTKADILACPIKANADEFSMLPPEVLKSRKLEAVTASTSDNSAMATHIMNYNTPTLGSTTKFLQTSNPIFQPRPEKVISSAWFERAVVNPESFKAVDELDRMMEKQTARLIQKKSMESSTIPLADRVWFVGSYAYTGIPLLEGCVVTATQAVERIMATEPQLKMNASIHADESSFLVQDAPMRARRQKRQQELQQKEKLEQKLKAVNGSGLASAGIKSFVQANGHGTNFASVGATTATEQFQPTTQHRRSMRLHQQHQRNLSASLSESSVEMMGTLPGVVSGRKRAVSHSNESGMSHRYFQYAWQDAILDEKMTQAKLKEQTKQKQIRAEVEEEEEEEEEEVVNEKEMLLRRQYGTKDSTWADSASTSNASTGSSIVFEILFMLFLYWTAIMKWSVVVVYESLGLDASSWALA